MTMEYQVKKWQTRIFIACFLAYMAAYICRVNFSVAIPGIQKDFNFSSVSMGIIGTSFFWVYALGQLVNGYLGDKVNSRIFIFAGLAISALINIVFGFCSTLFVMIILWAANGLFQSMLWGPIVKTLSFWFPGKKHSRIAFGMSITMIFGYLIAWGITGVIINSLNWRWVFWIAAVIVIIMAFIWVFMARNKPADEGLPSVNEINANTMATSFDTAEHTSPKTPLWKIITGTNLVFVALSGIAQGIVKDSISLWSPKFLMDTQNLSLKSAITIILIIPVINFSGIFLAGWIMRVLKTREKLTITFLMLGSAIASLGIAFFLHSSIIASFLMLACSSAFVYGANPLMTTIIPLNYSYCNKVSSIAGFIDFSIYLGSGLAGVITGLIVDMFGWDFVLIMWCAVSVAGALSMFVSILKDKNMRCMKQEGMGYE